MCYDCNRSYANKASLASHISRYHRSKENSNKSEKNVLLPNPTFMDITRKRSRSSDVSEGSESDNDAKVKRTKTKKFSNEEFSDEMFSKLVRVVAKLIKEVNQMHTTFGKVAKDIDKAEDKIDENKRNINRDKMFQQMGGSGIHMEMKRFYQKIMDENPNLIKDLKETQKTVHAIQQHTFFKEQLKESDKLKKELIKMEESFINAMEIRELFNGTVDDIRFKIKELQNAAHVAKAILELSETEELILKVII